GRLKKAELLRKDLASGLTGVSELMTVTSGKDVLTSFTEERNINKYKKKQVIYSEGNRPFQLFFIQKGKVKTYKINELAKELTVGLYSEGDFLGYIALMEGSSYRESAVAMEDTELAVIPRDDFNELINSSKEISQKFIKLLGKNAYEKEKQQKKK